MNVIACISCVAYFALGGAAAGAYLFLLWYSVTVLIRRRTYLPLLLGGVARFGLLLLLGFLALQLRMNALETVSLVLGFLVSRLAILKWVPMLSRKEMLGVR